MDEFDTVFVNATAAISGEYMHMPIAGQERPVYRERVYCYELYHQLRSRWPAACHYTLAGEVDKKGHPLVRGNGLDDLKPDLLVHQPGDMGGNYLVLEVKPITGATAGVVKDVNTVQAFLDHAEYRRGALLIFGRGDVKRTCDLVNAVNNARVAARRSEIELWWHSTPGSRAARIA